MKTIALLIVGTLSACELVAEELSFHATTVTGRTIAVARDDDSRLTVVCFLGAECPMARIYGPRLSRLAKEFRDEGVQFVGVNSNRQDSAQEVRQYVTSLKIAFPFVRDEANVIADQFAATRTPEVFVLDSNLNVRYHGRIDDQYEPGINRAKPKRRDLRIAIEELLAGRDVSVVETKALGCFIGKVPHRDNASTMVIVDNHITYTKHVSRVLQEHCLECHRTGDIGPFAMDSYDEVVGWAPTMMETIDNGRMPPWHANPQHGNFMNARHMPDTQKQIIRDWIAGGLKEGDAADLPEAESFVEGWQLDRDPDLVVKMRNRPFTVPADGVVEYQYFVADPKLTEDKWITGAQVIPGSRAVVHHAIAFVRPPDGSRFRGLGWLSAYVPGQRLVQLPPNHARFVPAGSKIVFQMHYTPNGSEQQDMTKIGLLFGNEKEVTHDVYTLVGINQDFEIPPNASDHSVSARVRWLPKHGHLLAATPHMHYRGKSFRLFAAKDDSQILLDIPHYDFNWQHTYSFAEPIPVANLNELRFNAVFDNSGANPFNPDPAEWVTWGDQTWEEMAVAFFEVANPRKKPTTEVKTVDQQVGMNERQKKIEEYVTKCMAKLDADGDDRITRDEAPIVVRYFSFRRVDKDGDGTITRSEVRKMAEQRY